MPKNIYGTFYLIDVYLLNFVESQHIRTGARPKEAILSKPYFKNEETEPLRYWRPMLECLTYGPMLYPLYLIDAYGSAKIDWCNHL